MTLKKQLLISILSLLIAGVAGIAGALWWLGADGMDDIGNRSLQALEARAQNQLASLRGVKSIQLADLARTMDDQVATFARGRTVIDASLAFAFDIEVVRHESDTAHDAVDGIRNELVTYIKGDGFLSQPAFGEYAASVSDFSPSEADAYVPQDPNAVVLWQHFLQKNPKPVAERGAVDMPEDLIAGYTDNHAVYHPVIRDFAERFTYRDIYIVKPKTGQVLYSINKAPDFANIIIKGPFADTGLAAVYAAADAAGERREAGYVAHADFAPYEPFGNEPVAFIATPVFDSGEYIAVLAFAVPVGKINRLMLNEGRFEEFGLGESGETYLVGPDEKRRSSSRFSDTALDVMRDTVDTQAASAALDGETGQGVVQDYMASKVLAAWQPVTIFGERYALIAQMDAAEALKANADLQEMTTDTKSNMAITAGAALLIFLILGTVVAYAIVSRIIGPLNRLGSFAERVAKGDFNAGIDGMFPLELDGLKRSIQKMVDELKNRLGFSQGILDAIANAFPCMTLDTDGRITFVGQHLLDVAGKSNQPEAWHGKTVGEFFFNDVSRKTRSDESLAKQARVEGEMDITSKGTNRTLQVTANPVFDLDGKQIGAFTLYFDLTTIRAQEAEIRAKNEKIASVAQRAVTIAEQVAESANVLSGQVEEAAYGARRQSDRASETATAMEEMNVTSMEVARNASSAADNATSARTQATEGQAEVNSLIESIEVMRKQADDLSGFMGKLGEQTDSVGNVIGVINDIADQTNLLALNAAIEAARAGDAGRGFAVVADEVRKLAEKTMQATKEVGDAIKAIQYGARQSIEGVGQASRAVEDSTGLARNSGETLQRIVDIVNATADQVQSIATAAEQQSATSEEVNRAVEDVTQVATQTAHGMDEANMAITRLAEQAEELQHLILELRDE